MNDMQRISRQERENACKQAIRECLQEKNMKGEEIKSLAAIYKYLDENGKFFDMSEQTFYRYIQEMGYKKVAKGHYILGENITSFVEMLEPRRYNKTLYFHITNPIYGPILQEIINYQFDDDLFHCIALDDMLICYYYYKKNENGNADNHSLTAKEIKKTISIITEKFTMTEAE